MHDVERPTLPLASRGYQGTVVGSGFQSCAEEVTRTYSNAAPPSRFLDPTGMHVRYASGALVPTSLCLLRNGPQPTVARGSPGATVGLNHVSSRDA